MGFGGFFMENKKQSEEIQSRRDFFKKAAKGALPILGAVLLANTPAIVKAAETKGCICAYSCSGSCDRTCSGSCTGSCRGSCTGNCTGGCTGSCSGSCRGVSY